jgi:NADPH:quinone reductase-like Zn-dependent oxidoreductase
MSSQPRDGGDMRSTQITAYGRPPELVERPQPVATHGTVLIRAEAVGIHQVVRARASGNHYTSTGALPLTPGVDGVGTTPDGTRVWFSTMSSERNGSLAEYVAVPVGEVVPLPPSLDPVAAAAGINPLIAAWMSLFVRGSLRHGQHLVVLGATGAAGRSTLHLARGTAGRVTAVGLEPDVLDQLLTEGLATDTIQLGTNQTYDELLAAIPTADVAIDYLWGTVAEQLWAAIGAARRPHGRTLQHVQTGTMAGAAANLTGATLRGADLRLTGSAPGAYSFSDLTAQVPALLERMAADGITVAHAPFPLAELDAGWSNTDRARTVFDLR